MKRTDITNFFPEATEEQIKTLMDLNGADVNAAKKSVEDLKSQLAKAQTDLAALQANAKELEALKEAQASAAEYKARLEALQKENQIRDARDKVAAATGIPAHLLSGQTETECKSQAETLLQWRAGRQKYPDTGDGGAPQGGGGGSTRDNFAQWAEEQL